MRVATHDHGAHAVAEPQTAQTRDETRENDRATGPTTAYTTRDSIHSQSMQLCTRRTLSCTLLPGATQSRDTATGDTRQAPQLQL